MLATIGTLFIMTVAGMNLHTGAKCINDNLNQEQCVERGFTIVNEYPTDKKRK